MNLLVNQSGAQATGDVIGGNKTEVHIHGVKVGVVEQLIKKLQLEIENNEEVKNMIESLQRYHLRRAHDGIDGLEAKLKAAQRDKEYLDALEKKELFVKLLDKWSLYASAQEIFAYLLAKAEHEFSYIIHPQIPNLDPVAVNQLVNDRIVTPTLEECGCSVFTLNHAVVMGMIYWLAEQCFIRWHQ